MLCALIQNNIVVAIETLQDADIQELGSQYQNIIQIDGMNPMPQVGDGFDGSNFIINSPVINWKITKLAFKERFTMSELVAIKAAAAPATTAGYTLQVMQDNMNIATYIDLSRADTIAGVNGLASFGILASGRATTILTTVPAASELYQG